MDRIKQARTAAIYMYVLAQTKQIIQQIINASQSFAKLRELQKQELIVKRYIQARYGITCWLGGTSVMVMRATSIRDSMPHRDGQI